MTVVVPPSSNRQNPAPGTAPRAPTLKPDSKVVLDAQHGKTTAWWTRVQAVITTIALIWAIWLYSIDADRKQADIAIHYVAPLQTEKFLNSLWNLTEFIKCHEREHKYAISFEKLSQVTKIERFTRTTELVRDFFDVVENDDRWDYCEKQELFGPGRMEMEKHLFHIYQSLESLASCMQTGLCEKTLIVDDIPPEECPKLKQRTEDLAYYTRKLSDLPIQDRLIESFDYQSVLGISNYLLLARLGSREWDGSAGNLPLLIDKIERYSDCVGIIDQNTIKFHQKRRQALPLKKIDEIYN